MILFCWSVKAVIVLPWGRCALSEAARCVKPYSKKPQMFGCGLVVPFEGSKAKIKSVASFAMTNDRVDLDYRPMLCKLLLLISQWYLTQALQSMAQKEAAWTGHIPLVSSTQGIQQICSETCSVYSITCLFSIFSLMLSFWERKHRLAALFDNISITHKHKLGSRL